MRLRVCGASGVAAVRRRPPPPPPLPLSLTALAVAAVSVPAGEGGAVSDSVRTRISESAGCAVGSVCGLAGSTIRAIGSPIVTVAALLDEDLEYSGCLDGVCDGRFVGLDLEHLVSELDLGLPTP